MAIQLIESWQTYSSTTDIGRRWYAGTFGGGTLVSGGLEMGGGPFAHYELTRLHPMSSYRIGFWFTPKQRAPSVTNSSCLHVCQGGDTNTSNQVGLGHNPDGTMSCFLGKNFSGLGGTTLANGTTVLALNTAYWLEFSVDSVTTSASATVELRINGVTEFIVTGVASAATGKPWIDRIAFAGGANITDYVFGALYIGDGAEGWLGPCNVQWVALTGDTAQKDFITDLGGADYTQLNDLSYLTDIKASSLNAADLYTIGTVSYNPADFIAAQFSTQTWQNGTQTQALALLVNDGTTVGEAAGVPGSTEAVANQTDIRSILLGPPSGGTWSQAGFSDIKIGQRIAPFGKGINFRATAGHFTDAAFDTYSLGEAYPTTRGGLTFGWDGAVTAADVNTIVSPFGGNNYTTNNGTRRTFRIDVPAAGRYQLRLLLDSNVTTSRQYAVIKDGSTTLFTLDSVSASQFAMDAGSESVYPSSQYALFNGARVITLTSTALNIEIGTPAADTGRTGLAHVELIALDNQGSLTGSSPDVLVSGTFAEALISTTEDTSGGGSDPVDITVTQGTPTVVQGGTVTITDGYLSASAPGITASALTFTVGTPPAHGTLKKSGVNTSSWTQDDLDNNRITYTESGNFASDSFTFTVSATGANTTTLKTENITITASPPSETISLTSDPMYIMRWDTEDVFNGYLAASGTGGLTAADITYTITTAPAHGTLEILGSPVSTFTQADIDAGQVFYVQNGDGVTFDSFIFTLSGGTATPVTGNILGITIEDLGFSFSSATVQPCPTACVAADCETSMVPAEECETSSFGCCE